jgi:hypothetical protein
MAATEQKQRMRVCSAESGYLYHDGGGIVRRRESRCGMAGPGNLVIKKCSWRREGKQLGGWATPKRDLGNWGVWWRVVQSDVSLCLTRGSRIRQQMMARIIKELHEKLFQIRVS